MRNQFSTKIERYDGNTHSTLSFQDQVETRSRERQRWNACNFSI